MTLDPNFPKLVLDPGDELTLATLAYQRIQTASGNTITDFRPGSSAAAFVEGQTFALAELLYYLNLMPEAIAIEVFRLYGVARSLGTFAAGTLTFRLAEVATDPFSLPVGYAVPYLDANLVFQAPLLIESGGQTGSVAVVSSKVGLKYNAKAFDVLVSTSGLSRVESIYNAETFTGGSDLEPLALLIPRCQAATVARNAIITKLDYEVSAQNLLGSGSRAVAVPNLASDGTSYQQAAVGVFILDTLGEPANPATCAVVQAGLKPNTLIGTSVAVFPAVLVPLAIEVFLNTRTASDAVGQAIITQVMEYLDPTKYSGGRQIHHNEIAYVCRQVDRVSSVDSVLINGVPQDYLLAQDWYYPYAGLVSISMIDPKGNTFISTGGLGLDDGFPEPNE